MRTTLAAVNQELAKRGYTARLARASGYFYFHFGEAADWLDRTIQVERVSDKTVEEWLAEFERLRALNAKLSGERRARKRKRRAWKGGPDDPRPASVIPPFFGRTSSANSKVGNRAPRATRS